MDLKLVYRWTSRGVLAVSVIFMVFVMSVLYPFIVGNFKVVPPSYKDVSYEIEDNFLVVKAPITIINEGLYDVNDLNIEMTLKNSSYIFAYNSQSFGKIPAGAGRIIYISLPIDLLKLLQAEVSSGYYHFFNNDNFDFLVNVKCKYALNTINVVIHYDREYLWEALIKEIEIYWEDATVNYVDNKTYLTIPFLLDTAKILRGSGEVDVALITDNGKNIGSGSTEIQLGNRYRGNLEIEINDYSELQKQQYLTLKLTLKFLGLEIVQSFRYYWEGMP